MNTELKDVVFSLDIGTTKIIAMVAKKVGDKKIEILGVGKSQSKGVHRGVVNNISLTIDSIKKAIAISEEKSGISIKDVIVGIAGQHIKSRQYSDYIVREKEDTVIDDNDLNRLMDQVYKLAMEPGERIIHVLPQDFSIDGEDEIYEPKGMYGTRVGANFHIVIGKISSMRNIANCVRESGLNLSDITLEPLASSKAVLNNEETEAGVALIDIGGGTTDLAIFKDNIIRHTTVIPFGGNVITEDIKSAFNIIYKHAEKLKIKFGSALPEENRDNEYVSIPGISGGNSKHISIRSLSEIIKARIQEIIEMVFLEIKSYSENNNPKKKLIAGIVITGGGAKLKHIKQLVEFVTGMECRIGIPDEHVYISNEDYKMVLDPIYSTSVGLAIIATENHDKNKNIKNREDIREDIKTEEVNIDRNEKKSSDTRNDYYKKKKGNMFSNWIDNLGDRLKDVIKDSE